MYAHATTDKNALVSLSPRYRLYRVKPYKHTRVLCVRVEDHNTFIIGHGRFYLQCVYKYCIIVSRDGVKDVPRVFTIRLRARYVGRVERSVPRSFVFADERKRHFTA